MTASAPFLRLLIAEFRRNLTLTLRYPTELISMIVVTTLLFYGLFLGASYLAGPIALGDRVGDALLSYVIWFLVIGIIYGLAVGIEGEARTGTLEHLHLSIYSPLTIFLARVTAAMGQILLSSIILMTVLSLLTGIRLTFDAGSLLAVVPIVLGAYSIGFFLASIAQVAKRVNQLMSLVQFGLLFFIVIPVENWEGAARIAGASLPVLGGVALLRKGVSQPGMIDWKMFAITTAASIIFLALALGAFKNATRLVKQRGQINHH
jgi:ABC-2 type transport system permease protein